MDPQMEGRKRRNSFMILKEFNVIKNILMHYGYTHQIMLFMKLFCKNTKSMSESFQDQLLNSFNEVCRDTFCSVKDIQRYRDNTEIKRHKFLLKLFKTY